MNFFTLAIALIIILILVRVLIGLRFRGTWVEVFQTTANSPTLPDSLTNKLKEHGIRYRVMYKGLPNQPFPGAFGSRFVTLEVHIEDQHRAQRVISQFINTAWRGRF